MSTASQLNLKMHVFLHVLAHRPRCADIFDTLKQRKTVSDQWLCARSELNATHLKDTIKQMSRRVSISGCEALSPLLVFAVISLTIVTCCHVSLSFSKTGVLKEEIVASARADLLLICWLVDILFKGLNGHTRKWKRLA